ncbi:uncharacterized protein BDW70DRAFT_171599 [Aspergillus foveolatus]|uniref:uncharacterized protein n=1 Tax=Aspergillus foveolatus TaxID=210207 RepID=UPI003CCD61FA
MRTTLANDSYHSPSRARIRNDGSMIIGGHSHEPSSGDHKPKDGLSCDPAIRQKGSRVSSMFARRKDHLQPKKIQSKHQCQLSPNRDDPPSNILEPWKAVSRRLPENSTHAKPVEQAPLQMHFPRSNGRLNACDCPSPERGPLCAVPSVVTTIIGGDLEAAAQKRDLPSRILEWANRLEEQAMTIVHDSYTLYFNTFTTNPDSNTSRGDIHRIKGAGVDRYTTMSSLIETVMTIQHSTKMTEDEIARDAADKIISWRSTVSQESDDSSISMQCSLEQGNRNHIDLLETRRYSLARRRESIEKALYNLMWHSRPCSAPNGMEAREEVKKITTRLNSELADIRREEHGVGLNLFRALKRRDEEEYCGSGSTSLWVSRVTR